MGITCKLREALEELQQPRALDDKNAVGVEAPSAADHVGDGTWRQNWRPPGGEAAQQGSVHVQHHCQTALVLRRLPQQLKLVMQAATLQCCCPGLPTPGLHCVRMMPFIEHMQSGWKSGSEDRSGLELWQVPGVAAGAALQEQRSQHPPPP